MRLAVVAAAVSLAIVGISAGAEADAAMRKPTHIAAQPLVSALQELAQERNIQVVYRGELVRNRSTAGASGDLTVEEALRQLLDGSGLTYHYLGDKAITIVPVSQSNEVSEPDGSNPLGSQEESGQGEGLAGLWARLRLAQANLNGAQGDSSVEKGNGDQISQKDSVRLEEVIVTSQKREERLQDVPLPVSVIDTQSLADNNQVLLKDYYTTVPGLSIQSDIVSQQELSIRGITQGGSGIPTVGVTVDDVPYGGSTNQTAGNYLPDFDPGELERIEVLRGPQGTLYGANSMGGLVKFVTVDPSTSGYSGRIEAGTSSVYNGAQPGYNIRGSVNIPVTDTLAMRASAYERQDPGYIDNPVRELKGVNEAQANGGRLAALWRPSEVFSVKLSAMYQYIDWDGASETNVAPGLTGLQQNYLPGMGGYSRTAQAYSAVIKAKLGSIDLTSLTGYNINKTHSTLDFTYAFGAPVEKAFGVAGAPYNLFGHVDRITQELRLSGSLWQKVDWLVGAYFSNEHGPTAEIIDAQDTNTLQIVGREFLYAFPAAYEEYAGFADLTYHVTDRFDIQLGARENHDSETFGPATTGGDYFGPAPSVVPAELVRNNAFTYLLTPQFKFTPDLMAYARFASGFRPGGPNAAFTGFPLYANPDKTQNYELGLKGDFLDHRLSVDASLYYIDWTNIQITSIDPKTSFQYVTNGSGAKSEGVELSVTMRPLTGMTVTGWFAYDDAVLTKAFPATSAVPGVPGDRLPIDPRISGHIALNQDFPLGGVAMGFVGGEVSYVGDRLGSFTTAPQRQDFPAYTKTDLRAGVKYESWTTNLYVNNVANSRGLVGGGQGYDPPNAFIYITPRTIGLSLTKLF